MSDDKVWSQDDPALMPLHPDDLPWEGIPEPATPGAVVSVSLINTAHLSGAANLFTTQREGTLKIPVICGLVEKDGKGLLFDLGIPPDVHTLPRVAYPLQPSRWGVLTIIRSLESVLNYYKPQSLPHPTEQMETEGYDLSNLTHVILSHVHFDHCGNLDALPKDTPVYLGPGSLGVIDGGYPKNEGSSWPSSWVENHNLQELPAPDKGEEWKGPMGNTLQWQKMGCFENAMDWFGDGSFWVIDAAGHEHGHLVALARVTASPPSYILLGGDTAHSQDLYLPVPPPKGQGPDKRSPIPLLDGQPSMSRSPAQRVRDIGQLTRMSMEDNVMVVLAHEPEGEGVLPLWPDNVDHWREKGWKAAKQKAREQGK